jgi:dTMP kinase
LQENKVVISDRYLDSSLAYQGIARGLGLEEIYRVSEWATAGLLPDIVFLLEIESESGLRRIDRDRDRIEQEDPGFHGRVADAYLELAQKFPKRFVVLDATRTKAEVHADVVKAYQERTAHIPVAVGAPHDLAAPGPPVPR